MVNELLQEHNEMNVYEQTFVQQVCKKKAEPGVHGNTIVKDSLLECVCNWKWTGLGSHITSAWNTYDGRSSSESGIA